MLDVAALVGIACTGATGMAVVVLQWRGRLLRPKPISETPWKVAREPDGSFSVIRHEFIPALGINEPTSYGGYSQEDAEAIARWLNDENDLRSMGQMLLDEAAKRKKAAEEMEQRRLAGGTPIYVMESHEPIDYVLEPGSDRQCALCAKPIEWHGDSDCACGGWEHTTTQQQDFEEYIHWTRKRLEALARQRYHLTLRQMRMISKEELVRLLAYDEPPSAPSAEDIYTEHDVRQALYAWRTSVQKNPPRSEWTIEQEEQLKFITARAEQLGLKHVLLSVMHGDPEIFDPPWRGMPTRSELR